MDRDSILKKVDDEVNSLNKPTKEAPIKKRKIDKQKISDLFNVSWRMVRLVIVYICLLVCTIGTVMAFFSASFLAGIFYVLCLNYLNKLLKEIMQADNNWIKGK